MSKGLGDKLVLAISSRALFDLRESHRVYESEGVEAYRQYQIEHEDEILMPGDAFPLVEKLLGLNTALSQSQVEVILVSLVSLHPCRRCAQRPACGLWRGHHPLGWGPTLGEQRVAHRFRWRCRVVFRRVRTGLSARWSGGLPEPRTRVCA